jgi:uncharacterized damage-inducible protein DinB
MPRFKQSLRGLDNQRIWDNGGPAPDDPRFHLMPCREWPTVAGATADAHSVFEPSPAQEEKSVPTNIESGLTPEVAAFIRENLLFWALRELETTKKVLSAIPDARRDYRPDPHARSAWELAWHLTSMDIHFLDGIADFKLNLDVPDPDEKSKPKAVAELVEWYDKNFKRATGRIRALTPEQLVTPIDFLGAFKLPAVGYLAFFNNHRVHHRGQLATYLRPMGSKCPAIYGASFDEPTRA